VRLEEGRIALDDVLIRCDRALGLSGVEIHRAEVGLRARVVGAERQVLLERRNRLLVVVPVVVEVRDAAERVGVLRVEREDVVVGVDRVRLVGGIELGGARTHLSELHPRVDVVGLLLRLRRQVDKERLRLIGERDAVRRVGRRAGRARRARMACGSREAGACGGRGNTSNRVGRLADSPWDSPLGSGDTPKDFCQ